MHKKQLIKVFFFIIDLYCYSIIYKHAADEEGDAYL